MMADDLVLAPALYRDPGDLALGGFVDRDTFRFVRDYPHPPSMVWGALIDSEQLSVWLWPCSRFEARLGGIGVFNPGKEVTLKVTEFDPPKRLTLSDRVRFTIEPIGPGSRLTLDFMRPDDGWSPMALAGAHGWIGRLSRLLARRPQAETEAWALGIWNAVFAHCEWEVTRFVAGGEKVLWRIHFADNDARLSGEAAAVLDELAERLSRPGLGVTLDGFGDDDCDADTSVRLCADRIAAASAHLAARGVPREQINVGFVLGNYHYLVERDGEAGRAFNRRIELRPVY
ncbi:MAG: SRPBCC domain-containing protein [Mycobacteriales bacterium]